MLESDGQAIRGTKVMIELAECEAIFQDALIVAQSLFGARDTSWTILPCGVNNEREPHMTYCGSTCVRVLLPLKIIPCVNVARQVIGHEAIHAIGPGPAYGKKSTSVLEEGIACIFGHSFGVLRGAKGYSRAGAGGSYEVAIATTVELLAIDPAVVEKLRARCTAFGAWTAELLRYVVPAIPDELLNRLLAPFDCGFVPSDDLTSC